MAELITADLCVIGAGAGGLSVAAGAAAFGASTVLVEKGGMDADSLRRTGCVPSKALRAAAARASVLRDSAPFGVAAQWRGVDFAAVNTHMRAAIGAVAPNFRPQRFAGLGARIVKGIARFTDTGTVAVDGFAIKARRFVIATGSSPLIPPIPGLVDTPHFTSETVFDLAECPRHLIVIGAGAVGLELAQSFRRLGAAVTVLEAATPLAGEDSECAAIVLHALGKEGITLRNGVEIAKVGRSGGGVHVVLATPGGTETVEGSHLLVAAGRRPNLDELDLDAGRIRYRPDGIIVDRRLTTSNKRVYAVGDVTGGPPSAHLAHYHAGLVIGALFRLRVSVHDRAVPRVIHTDPELAHVGLCEEEARAKRGAIRVLRWPYRENDRAQSERATTGHIKVVTGRHGDILGATIVGAHAAENITAWTLAIDQKLNISAFAGLVVPYPTYTEVGKRAAVSFFNPRLTPPRPGRIMGWLRRAG